LTKLKAVNADTIWQAPRADFVYCAVNQRTPHYENTRGIPDKVDKAVWAQRIAAQTKGVPLTLNTVSRYALDRNQWTNLPTDKTRFGDIGLYPPLMNPNKSQIVIPARKVLEQLQFGDNGTSRFIRLSELDDGRLLFPASKSVSWKTCVHHFFRFDHPRKCGMCVSFAV